MIMYIRHMLFLAYKEDNSWYWFENADFSNRGIHKFNTFNELLNYQYKKYIEFLKTFNISDEEIEKIIITEFDKPKENICVEEYLNHTMNSKHIEKPQEVIL